MNTVISNAKSKAYFPLEAGRTSQNPEAVITDSFSKVFDQTQNPEDTDVRKEPVKSDDGKMKAQKDTATDSNEKIQNHANIQKNKSSKNVKEQPDEISNTEVLEEAKEAVKQAADVMVEAIAQMFQVSPEEVENVLNTLGLSATDLLNGENLKTVILAFNPECDAMALMTDEQLFSQLKSLVNTAKELEEQIAQKFHLTQDEMKQLLDGVKMTDEALVTEENSEVKNISQTVTDMILGNKENVTESTENLEIQNQDNASQNDKIYVTKEFQDSSVDRSQNEIAIPKADSEKSMGSDTADANKDTSNMANQSFAQNVMNQLSEAIENKESVFTSYGVRGQDILNQITEQIRIHVSQETTEMELQLHPASLGNVKVQIASTGGVLTAVFTTENEAVKAALESQLVQLKENFAQQGLKVESVEVNVSTQGFERSLDQQEQQQNQFEQNRSKKGSRRIQFNGVDEAGEGLVAEISADDKIVADMMIRNGNSVDYMV